MRLRNLRVGRRPRLRNLGRRARLRLGNLRVGLGPGPGDLLVSLGPRRLDRRRSLRPRRALGVAGLCGLATCQIPLVGQRVDLGLHGLKARPQLLALGPLGLKRRLGIKLGLRDLLDKDPANLDVGQIGVCHQLFFELLHKLGPHRLAICALQLVKVAVVDAQALEDGVVIDEVGVHLDHVLIVHGHLRVVHVDRVAHLVVALHELPQLVAGTIIGVLDHKVRALDGAMNARAPVHKLAKRRLAKRHHQAPHAVDTHEGPHVIGVVLGKALAVLNSKLDGVLDLFIRVVDLAVHLKAVADLVSRGPKDHVGALVHKGQKALDQVVDKAVLVQVIGLARAHVKDARGVDAAVVRGRQELRVLRQVAHAVGRDLACQRDRHDFLLGRDETPRLLDDRVDRGQGLLDDVEPLLVNDLLELFSALLDRRVRRLGQLKEIAKVAVVLLDGLHLLREARIEVLNGV